MGTEPDRISGLARSVAEFFVMPAVLFAAAVEFSLGFCCALDSAVKAALRTNTKQITEYFVIRSSSKSMFVSDSRGKDAAILAEAKSKFLNEMLFPSEYVGILVLLFRSAEVMPGCLSDRMKREEARSPSGKAKVCKSLDGPYIPPRASIPSIPRQARRYLN